MAVRDVDALNAVVLDKLTGRPELGSVRTSVIYGHHQKKVIEPLCPRDRPGIRW